MPRTMSVKHDVQFRFLNTLQFAHCITMGYNYYAMVIKTIYQTNKQTKLGFKRKAKP